MTGPHVWLDSVAVNTHSDDGPHHRWATGILFDNLDGERLYIRNREDSGSGHGWAAAQSMIWNSEHTLMTAEAPTSSMNYLVGGPVKKWGSGVFSSNDINLGHVVDFLTKTDHEGIYQSLEKKHPIRSLYLRQLEERLGEEAVRKTTTKTQLKGDARNALRAKLQDNKDWEPRETDPTCLRGKRNGVFCCHNSCGQCGGSGCGKGGADRCCTGNIKEKKRSCDKNNAPCMMSEDPLKILGV